MKKLFLAGLLAWTTLVLAGASFGQGCFFDDASFFSTAVKPNVFLLLDRSGSMCWRPAETYYPCAGSSYYYACDAPYAGRGQYGNDSKIHLATEAIKTILDADSSGTVTDSDSLSLNIRLGYGHYYNSYGEASGLYIPYNNDTIGTRYTKLWADAQNDGTCGGTPMNSATWQSKELVKNTHRNEGPTWSCRKSFQIVITDGEDTWGCGGSGSSGTPNSRRAGVNVTYTANVNDTIPTFVIGFGATMPLYLRNELNWMALKGGTDNPLRANSGDTMYYAPENTGGTYQSCDFSGTDPGSGNLDGYAFIATNGNELRAALAAIFKQIQQSSGSTFSPPSVPANFTASSMLLVNNFDAQTFPKRWRGHLGAFKFKANGDMPLKVAGGLDTTYLKWDAGNILRRRNITADPRTILTPLNSPTGFYLWPLHDTLQAGGLIRPESLGLAAGQFDSLRTIVNYMYYDSTGSGNAKFGWLGDPFHSGPVDVGSPNPFFTSDSLYSDFVFNLRGLNRRVHRVYLQSNDGMMHVIRADSSTQDSTLGGGRELYAIAPRHVRPWLRDQLYAHDYTLDGPVLATHVLVPGLASGNPLVWQWQDWRTILVCGERTGGRNYYALDVTRPDSTPGSTRYLKYLWEYGANSPVPETAMGYTFGKAAVCLVKDSTASPYRRYVAFLPGGYDCNRLGRGNFVLALDAYTGQLLKKINLGSFGVAAQVRPVDLNYDGYADRLYVGDINGDMWRIILDNPRYAANWHAQKVFQATGLFNKPIFGGVSVAANYQGYLYIMWGTGDRNRPTDPTSQNGNAVFSVQDRDVDTLHAPYSVTDLRNVKVSSCVVGDVGWYEPLYNNANSYLEVFTNLVTVSDTVRVLAWNPSGAGGGCNSTGSGSDTLISYLYTCGNGSRREHVGTGIPPSELPWGVDRRGVVTLLLPNLQKKAAGVLNRGKFIRVWREVY